MTDYDHLETFRYTNDDDLECCFTKLCGVTILTTLGGRVDVETVVLQPGSDSQEVAHEAGDPTIEHSGVAGKHVGVQHPGFVLLDHNWGKKKKESIRLAPGSVRPVKHRSRADEPTARGNLLLSQFLYFFYPTRVSIL